MRPFRPLLTALLCLMLGTPLLAGAGVIDHDLRHFVCRFRNHVRHATDPLSKFDCGRPLKRKRCFGCLVASMAAL